VRCKKGSQSRLLRRHLVSILDGGATRFSGSARSYFLSDYDRTLPMMRHGQMEFVLFSVLKVSPQMNVEVVKGDLLAQPVDVIVNAWNRNFIPWWLLIPQGVSGAIKKRAGIQPFLELPWKPIPLGEAVLTSAGKLPFKAIIHVAGINLLWRSSERSIRDSVVNAVEMARANNFSSIAIPIIGSGSGGFPKEKALSIMRQALGEAEGSIRIVIVDFDGG
jgi:O-acetyl-ADP-ribose deacetylase